MTIPRHVQKGLALAAAVLVIDQITKWWIVASVMQPPRMIEITPFLNLVMGWNYGVSFGMLNSAPDLSKWLLPLVTVAITGGLVYWLFREHQRWTVVGLGLSIGGAVGNLIDRLRFGAVADFLDVHAFGYHWPAFNAADSAITVGAIVVILESLFVRDEKP